MQEGRFIVMALNPGLISPISNLKASGELYFRHLSVSDLYLGFIVLLGTLALFYR
jgi:hypothetical protein